MPNMKRRMFKTVAVVATIVIISSPALADSVQFDNGPGNDGALGAFTGEFSYEAQFDNDLGAFVGMLTVELENTSAAANGGFITAFAFNVPRLTDNSPGGELLSSTDPDFDFISADDADTSTNARPFGMGYDMGASISDSWGGGGNPSSGIGVGESAMFSFKIFSGDVTSMSASDFLTFDRSPWDDESDWMYNFVVRMRGFNDGDSDKLNAVIVPVPAPVALGLAGLMGVGIIRRRMITQR